MSELTRRTFFKGAAALGAAAMLGGCAPQEMKETDGADAAGAGGEDAVVEVKHAWCKMCGPARTHCSTLCTVREPRP